LLDVAYPATAVLVVAALATPWVLPLTAVFAAALVLTTVLIESG